MINFFLLILSLFISTVFGAGILFLICKRKKIVIDKEKFFIWSFALGTGLMTFLYFWLGLLKISFLEFSIALVILDTIFLIFIFKKGLPFIQVRPVSTTVSTIPAGLKPKKRNRWKIWETILILIIVFEIIFVFSAGALRPIINFDALDNWAFKAKVFFYHPEAGFSSSNELFLGGGSHQNYPLHVPLLMSWSYYWLGEVDDVLITLIFSFYFLFLLWFFYFCLRKFKNRKVSLIFTALLASIPLFTYHGSVAYADLILCFYFTLASLSLYNFLKTKKEIDLIGLGLFSGLLVWSKNEGLVLGLILIFVLFLFLCFKKTTKKDFKKLLKPAFGFLLFTLPWLVFKICHGLGYSNISASEKISFGVFHPEVFSSFMKQIFVFHSFHLWPGIFLILLLIFWKNIFKKSNIYLFLIFLISFSFYLFLYFFTPSFQFVLQGTIVGRNLIVLLPLSIFFIAIIMEKKGLSL